MSKNNNPKKYKNKFYQTVQLLMFDDEFRTDLKKLYTKAQDLIDNGEIENDKVWINFTQEIEQLRIKYNLSPRHFIPLRQIILYRKGVLDEEDGNIPHPDLKTEYTENNSPILYLALYPETSVDDIQVVWPAIEEKIKEVYGYEFKKQQPFGNLFIRNYIEFIKQSKLNCSNKEIAKIINNVFKEQNISLYYHEVPIKMNQIKKTATALKKRLTKNKKQLKL